MSVYIPNMKLPDKDHTVLLELESDGKAFAAYDGGRTRLVQFDAISVPDHGRLGDLDKLESGLRLMAEYQEGYRQQGILGCCETIRAAKTIIPPDKEGAE